MFWPLITLEISVSIIFIVFAYLNLKLDKENKEYKKTKDEKDNQSYIQPISNSFTEPTNKREPMVVEIYKQYLVELYDFAYEQALKTGKVDDLKEIDRKINGD